jgi:hypothetical protein
MPRGMNPAFAGLGSVYFIEKSIDLSKLELKTLDIEDLIDFQEKWEQKTALSREPRSVIECLSSTVRDRLESKARELRMPGMYGLIGPDNQPNVSNDEIFDIISELIRPTSKMGMSDKFERIKFPFYDSEMFVSRGGRLEHFEEIRHLISKHAARWAKRIKLLTHNGEGLHLLPSVYSRKDESKGMVQIFMRSNPGDLGRAILKEVATSELESLNTFDQFRQLLEHSLNGLQKLQYQITERQAVFGISRKDPINKDKSSYTNSNATTSTYQSRAKLYDQYKKSYPSKPGYNTNQYKHSYDTRSSNHLRTMLSDENTKDEDEYERAADESTVSDPEYGNQYDYREENSDNQDMREGDAYDQQGEELLALQVANNRSVPCNNMILYGNCKLKEFKGKCSYSHDPKDIQMGKAKLAQRLMSESSSAGVHTSSATPTALTMPSTHTTPFTPTIMKRPESAERSAMKVQKYE